jgi:hypothetical protein
MKWPSFNTVSSKISLPPGYGLSQLKTAEIDHLLKQIPFWYPDALVGEESYHLQKSFWLTSVQLAEVEDDRDFFPVMISWNGDFVGFFTIEKNPRALTVMGRLGAVAAEHRGVGLSQIVPPVIEALGREIGAEAVLQIVTMKSHHMQSISEQFGYTLCGILPGFDRDMVKPGVVKRVCEAYYIKLLVDESELQIPKSSSLTDATRNLWEFLFPQRSLR